MSDKYYPRLSRIVKVDQLPEQLNFIQTGLNSIFDDLGFRNLRVIRSIEGDTASFEFDIVSYKQINFEIPGTDLTFELNPGTSGFTAISFSLTTQLGIKRYVKDFKLSNFSFQP